MNSKIIGVTSALVLFAVVGYTSYQFNSPQSSEINLVTTPSGSVTLTLASPTSPLIVNTDYTLSINYASPTQHLTAVSAILSYDPTLVTVSGFTANTTFPTTLQTAKYETGKLSFAIGVKPEVNAGIMGSGTIATFHAKPLKTGNLTFTFTDPTLATVIESNTSALQGVSSPTITVKNPALSGDFNQDDTVNLLDFNLLITNYGNPYTLLDFNSLLANFGKTR